MATRPRDTFLNKKDRFESVCACVRVQTTQMDVENTRMLNHTRTQKAGQVSVSLRHGWLLQQVIDVHVTQMDQQGRT